ncbi:hypothetical protein [Planctobacterium marinum]
MRLRKGTFISLVLFMTAYFMLPKLGFWDILHRNMGFLLTLAFITLALAFGLLHGILWRKKNYWLFLLHRPMSPKTIYLSLLLSGVAVITMTVFLSLMLTSIGYDVFTDKVVDTRHYLFTLYITLLCIACYMLGTLTVLHRSKFVILCFYAMTIAFFPEPNNALAQYLPLLILLPALFYLNLQSFKPDLNSPIKSALGTGLLAAGTSYGIALVLLFTTVITYHLPLAVLGSHPDSSAKPGSMQKIWENNFKNAIGYVLENSDHPQAEHYAYQATLAKRKSLPITPWQPPYSQQLHRFDNSDNLSHPEFEESWKFSHDEMLLIGINSRTNQFTGAIGTKGFIADLNDVNEADRFAQIPHLSGGRYLSTQDSLFKMDFESRALLLKHQPAQGEFYTSGIWGPAEMPMISTNKHLILFDPRTLQDDFSSAHVDYQFGYPQSTQNAEFGYGFSVADGYLLLFLGEDYYGFDRPGAEVFVARLDGSVEQLGAREFTVHRNPAWVRHFGFMISPFIYASEELVMHTIDPFEKRFLSLDQISKQQYPNTIYTVAILLQISSVFIIFWLVTKHQLQSRLRWTWLAVVTVMGLPALLSYLVLQPIRR